MGNASVNTSNEVFMFSRRMYARALRWKLHNAEMVLRRAWCKIYKHDYRFLDKIDGEIYETCHCCRNTRKVSAFSYNLEKVTRVAKNMMLEDLNNYRNSFTK